MTRGTLGLHQGELKVTGPNAFSVSADVGAGAKVPVPISVLVPSTARVGSIVSLGFSFFGQVGSDTKRKLLGSDACVLEVVR